MAIREALLERADWRAHGDARRADAFELRTFDELHLELERVAAAFDDPDLLVFASKHAGETGPLLTAHFTGNFGPADHGGATGELAAAAPDAQKRVVAALESHAPPAYDVGIECTHHGPSEVGVPSMFVELGSSASEWTDPEGAAAIAESILELGSASAGHERTVVSFGDDHYAPRPARVLTETDWRVGHIGSDWALDAMGSPASNPGVLRAAFERSGASRALVAGDRPELRETIAGLGYRVVSETFLQETTGVPLSLVAALEGRLGEVSEGLRFGAPARERDGAGEYVVRDLPDELLAECAGIDQEGTRAAVAAATLAYETVEGGTLVEGRAAFPDGDAYDDLIASLGDLLAGKYDDVTRTEEELVAERAAFDPEAAHEAGVPEGPAFGALADGETVEVDGKTVEPATVRRSETLRFDL